MSRRPTLTEEQWAQVGKRLLEGESIAELAREFKVGESTIRSHFARKGQKTTTIKDVASKLFDAEQATSAAQQALKTLPQDAQYVALSLASKMRSISESLASAAEIHAKTSMRLASLANSESAKIDDASPLKSAESIKSVVLLTKASNESAHIPLNLLSANKEQTKRQLEEERALTGNGEEVLTPERRAEGLRRIAFMLQRAASQEN